ncbi:MAG: AI-2E family transporter [Halobacteriales archaeon]
MNRQQAFFVAVTLLGVGIGALMVAGFLPYLLAGGLLAFVTRPVHRRLAGRVPASVAAGVVVALTVLVAVLPVLVTFGAVADDAAALARGLSLEGVPNVAELESLVEQYTGQEVDLAGRLRAGLRAIAGWAAGSASGLVGAAADVLIGVSVMLLVQFYAVRDWEEFAAWTLEFDVLPTGVQARIYETTGRATWSVVKGHVLVAILQAIAAGVGLLVAGIPNVFFWTFLMVVLGFIPMVGSAMVWAPAGVYLLLTGDPVAGAGLLVYGGVLVGALDNLARPLLVDESVDLNDLFVLLGVVGGVSVFGPIGLFVGPVVYAVVGELLDVYQETYDDLDPA